MRLIQVVNQSSVVGSADLSAMVSAVQRQITEHVAPHYGIDAQLVLSEQPEKIRILDTSDQADALGYHDATDTGFVFAKTTLAAGDQVSATFSHEALEQLADRWAGLSVEGYVQQHRRHGRSRVPAQIAYELCDAVENDEYQIDGVAVSNFCLPAWFDVNGVGPFDYLGKLLAPFTLSPGGYFLYATAIGNWQQQLGGNVPAHQIRPERYSRRHRRGLR